MFRIVREFCSVKCDAGRGDSRLRGNDVGECGNDGRRISDAGAVHVNKARGTAGWEWLRAEWGRW